MNLQLTEFSSHWQLDPNVIYLNHGSFGPSPLSVQEAKAAWSAKLEAQPMRFFCQQAEEELHKTAEQLASLLHTKAAHLALVDNATVGMNIAAASIALSSGDEVLFTDHEYGAVRNIWQARCETTGANLQQVELPLDAADDQIVNAITNGVSSSTKVVVISHVTSATAMILPLESICRRLRQDFGEQLKIVVDGPHALAMLDVNLKALNCDFYCCSGHKWFCGSFGAGFLYVHPRHQADVRCPIISWGGSVAGHSPTWQDRTNWLGTRDLSGLLSLSATIEFWKKIGFGTFRKHAKSLLQRACESLTQFKDVDLFLPNADSISMCAFRMPQPPGWSPGYHGHPDQLQVALRDEYQIEVPVFSWNGVRLLRLSAHLYNTQSHIDRLVDAVEDLCVGRKL